MEMAVRGPTPYVERMLALLPVANMPPVFIGIFIAFVIAIIAGAIFQSGREKKRSELLEGWADHNGFHFMPKARGTDSTFDERFPSFDCLRQGDNRYAFNIARGEKENRDVWAFDYHYRTQSTDSKGRTTYHHHNFSSVVVGSGMALKPLFLRAEGWWDKMTSVFGFDDIDFESAEFSRKFFVKAPDRKWAYDVIHQETMEFLLRAPRFSIQLAGPHAIIWRGRRFEPADFEHALSVIDGVLRRIPRDIQREIQL